MPLFLGVKGKCYVIIPNLKVIMAYAATVQVIHPSPTSSYPSPPYSAFLLTTYTLYGGEKEKPLISAVQPLISFAMQEMLTEHLFY